MPRKGIIDRFKTIDLTNYDDEEIDPRELKESVENTYSQENIQELADNMLIVGQLQELVIAKVGEEKIVIIGHRRRRAGILNIERGHNIKLRCKIKTMSQTMLKLTLHSANIFNRKLTDWELMNGVEEYKKYLEAARDSGEIEISGGVQKYLSNALGISTGKLGQIGKTNKSLCEEGKEALKNGEINFTSAYETSKLPEDKQKEVLQNKALLSSEIKEIIREEREKTEAAVHKAQEAAKKAQDYSISAAQSTMQAERAAENADSNVEKLSVSDIYIIPKYPYPKEKESQDLNESKNKNEAAGQTVHQIKLASTYYNAKCDGLKPFELRKNDRGYKVGDILEEMEYKDGNLTGRTIRETVTFMLENYTGLQEGYCILGTQLMDYTAREGE